MASSENDMINTNTKKAVAENPECMSKEMEDEKLLKNGVFS